MAGTMDPAGPMGPMDTMDPMDVTLEGEPAAGAVGGGGGEVPASWDRYEVQELLGRGGMGEVYKARDLRLDRTVAIKFIRGADPSLTMRLLREARAQARIDHPNVCRVHEVGEIDGRAYIAIGFVDGQPLHRVAARMSLEEKVAVLRDVALAIHEAHRLGIVHRDLKPANVLVEVTEDGRWFPVVMDFGLAREETIDLGLTRSGAVIGTPSYMAPEQALGELHAIDRRSDVYSLGATLYELLTGRPPFAQASLALVLAQVIHDDPPAPRALVPSVPVDLETIALKCLAKDPGQRYPSARALADELGRYLDGEPILGRQLALWQRLRLRARRHRALVVLGGWSLVALAVVGALGLRAWVSSRWERGRSAERTALAQRFGQQVVELELFLHTAYQLPLQDTRPAQRVVRARMKAIAATDPGLGALGEAVIHEALGRGHLALHEWTQAADQLALAAQAGLRTPELAAARARALGELYHRALETARRSGSREWLAGRQRQLALRYLAPAAQELAHSAGSGDRALLEARLALYRNQFEEAERGALAAAEHAPWLFEAPELAAEAAYAAAVAAFDRGEYDRARAGLERAATRYAHASEIARSDASLYQAAAEVWLLHAEVDFRQGRSPRHPLEQAIAAIDRALRADPDDASAHTAKAQILLRWHTTPALRDGEDQRPLLARIAESAARAVELEWSDANAWDALGNAHISRGIWENYNGGEGAPWWNRAIGELLVALLLRPDDPWPNNDLGVAHFWLGVNLAATGGDAMPEYRASLRSCQRATELDPQYVYAWSNQTMTLAAIAEIELARGVDPQATVEAAQRAGEAGLRADPSFGELLTSMAIAQLFSARYLLEHGGDPAPPLSAARRSLDRSHALHPEFMNTWFYRIVAARLAATYELQQGRDPARELATGRAALGEALRLMPGSGDSYTESARLDLVEAGWAARSGRDASLILRRARVHAERAIAIDRQIAEASLVAAEVALAMARAQRAPAAFAEDRARGIAYAEAALALNPRLAGARTVRAELEQLSPSAAPARR
jgi:eukaryotic-like serine/threonine-protein kinase